MAKAASGRPTAITKLKDASSQGKRNWIIYGDSGKGKTVLAGTAENALFLTVESAGTESAKAFGSTADEWVTDTAEEFREAYDYLKRGGGCDEFETLIIDSGSEVEEIQWKETLDHAVKGNSNRSLFQPAIQDYQVVGNKMKAIVNQFNRLPINVIYTFQAMRLSVQDADGDDSTLLLPLVGSTRNGVISQKVCGMVTLVGCLTVVAGEGSKSKDERRLWTASSDRMFAKDRHDTFERYVKNPTIPEMFAAVNARIADSGPRKPKKKKKKKKKEKVEAT